MFSGMLKFVIALIIFVVVGMLIESFWDLNPMLVMIISLCASGYYLSKE